MKSSAWERASSKKLWFASNHSLQQSCFATTLHLTNIDKSPDREKHGLCEMRAGGETLEKLATAHVMFRRNYARCNVKPISYKYKDEQKMTEFGRSSISDAFWNFS